MLCLKNLVAILFLTSTFAAQADWGDVCNSTEECSDHRYVCEEDEFEVKRCFCDRFHEWFNSSLGCIQIFNATYIINNTVTPENDVKGRHDRVDDEFFALLGISGLFVFAVVIFASVNVVVYCIYVHQSDKQLEKLIKKDYKIKV